MDEQSKLLLFFFLQRRHLQHTQWPLTPHGLFITTLRPCHCFYFVHNYYSEHPVVWGVEVSSGQGPHKVRTFLQVSARPLVDHIIFETGEFGPLQHIQLKMSANAITCDFFSFFFFFSHPSHLETANETVGDDSTEPVCFSTLVCCNLVNFAWIYARQ